MRFDEKCIVYFLFYSLSSLPALALNFGLGNIPVRYLALVLFACVSRVRRVDLLLPVGGAVHLLYAISVAGVRPFTLLDLSYVLSFFYILLGIWFVRARPDLFRIFVIFFWVLNVIYAAFQNAVLMQGKSQSWVLFHENTHDPSYIIPQVELFSFFYRVTGLFIESAPFVIYLIMTHFAFSIFQVSRWLRLVNLIVIFLAGAKVGYLFLLLFLASSVLSVLRIRVCKFIVFGCALMLFFAPWLLGLISEANSFGSLWVRLSAAHEIVTSFYSSPFGMIFGYGFVSSAQLISGDFEGPMRGIDFFSTYIYANGLLGSLLLLSPILLWVFNGSRSLTFAQGNLSSIVIFLALLTMGSLLNFQYAYYIFLIAFSSGEGVRT